MRRSIVDNLLEGLQVIGPDYRYLYINDTVASHGRTTPLALLGRRMEEAYPGIEDSEMFCVLRRCMETRTPAWMENRFSFPDGSEGWFELRFEPVPEGVAILSVDISERKRSEAALQRTVRALTILSRCNQTLARAVDEGALMADVCRLVVDRAGYATAWVGRLAGDDPASLVGTACAGGEGFTRAASSEPAWVRLLSLRALQTRHPAAARFAREDPEHTPWAQQALDRGLRCAIALPIWSNGAPTGTLAIAARQDDAFGADERLLLDEVVLDLGYGIETLATRRAQQATLHELETAEARARGVYDRVLLQGQDVSQQREIERRLAAVQRLEAVGRLAGGVAHDFNNLLSVILSHAELAMDRAEGSEALRADIEQVVQASQRAASLTGQLLAFSRTQRLQAQIVDLNRVVLGIQTMLQRLLEENIEIQVDLAEDLGSVKADPSQLEQILMNLAVNARDAMPDGGKLVIETANVEIGRDAEDGGRMRPGARPYVRLTVADTGQGMTAQVRERVFEPFFTTKTHDRGTGLGLSTIYGIVERSGGDIRIWSEPGQGAVFTIDLPRLEAAPPRQ